MDPFVVGASAAVAAAAAALAAPSASKTLSLGSHAFLLAKALQIHGIGMP